jgi:hypothetical protein
MRQTYFVLLSAGALLLLVDQLEVHAQEVQQPDSTKILLLDAERVAAHLQLNASQVSTVSAFIEQIRDVIKQDEKKIAEMRAHLCSGDKPGLFEKLKLRGQRNERVDHIESLVDNIKEELTPEQREQFSDIVVPELPKLSPKSIESE